MPEPIEIGFFRNRQRRHMNPFYVRPATAEEDHGGYLTLEEAAQLCGLPRRQTLSLIEQKLLVGHRERGLWLVTRYSLEAHLGARLLPKRGDDRAAS